MPIFLFVAILAVAHPLGAQTSVEPRIFNDTTWVQGADKIWVQDAAYQLPDRANIAQIAVHPAPPPNSAGELQQVIDKTMTSRASSVLVMDMDSVMLSRALIPDHLMPEQQARVQRLLRSLKSIKVRMFDVDEDVRSKVQPIQDVLKTPNWVRYSSYTSKNEEIGIWSSRWGASQRGVFLLSVTGRRVFAMNVEGEIGPDQLIYLSGIFGIPNFKSKLDVPLDSR